MIKAIKFVIKGLLFLLLGGILISLNLQFIFLGGVFFVLLKNENSFEAFLLSISLFALPLLLFDYIQNVFYGYSFLMLFLIVLGFKSLMLLFHASKVFKEIVLSIVVILIIFILGSVAGEKLTFVLIIKETFIFMLGYLLVQWIEQRYDV